jgi:hypothetical protein
MLINNEQNFIEKKDPEKIYVSKRIENKSADPDTGLEIITPLRYVSKVIDSKEHWDYVKEAKEIQIRLTPGGKQEILAKVLEKNNGVYILTFQKYTTGTGSPHQVSFSFVGDEITRIKEFLENIILLKFPDASKTRIEDSKLLKIKKLFLENPDADLIKEVLKSNITNKDIVALGYRKKQLGIFKENLKKNMSEKDWQEFFFNNQWIFGYGLDYRFMTIFDREMSVGDGGTQDQNKPKVDFLNQFSDFTVLVELKLPSTPLFKNDSSSAGTWNLSDKLFSAYSQVLEQKAEWHIKGDQCGKNISNDGFKGLTKRTRDPKVILVIGNKANQIESIDSLTEKSLKADTFELFRRDSRNVEIITYDELYERAEFIVSNLLKN